MVLLASCNFGTAQTTGHLSFNTLGAKLHGAADALFHRTAERNSFFELLCNILSDKLSV